MLKAVRRLYDWVLTWANSRYALLALGLLAFTEASFFPIPPDVLIMALALSMPQRSFRYALIATVGSVLGAVLGYAIGWGLWDILASYFYAYVPGVTEVGFARVGELFSEYDFWIIFAAGFTPIPYKIFTIAAGVFAINFPVFILASLIGRGLRFYLVAALFYYMGQPARTLIEKYFNLLTVIVFVLIALAVIIIRLTS
jgi:membrane protein YqaA with SNARE-associated domain